MSEETAPRRVTNRPWGHGPPQLADKLLAAAIVFRYALKYALRPAVPYLLTHHLLLLAALRGTAAPLITLGALARTGEGSLVVAALIGLPALMSFDILFWLAGRRWGEGGIHMLLDRMRNRRGLNREQQVERLQTLTRKYGAVGLATAYVGPIPSVLVSAMCGWSGMRFRVFLLWDTIGALLWTTLMVTLGYAIGQRAVDVVRAITPYSLYLSGVLIVVVLAQLLVRRHRRRAA
jgi:membrane-associated protein